MNSHATIDIDGTFKFCEVPTSDEVYTITITGEGSNSPWYISIEGGEITDYTWITQCLDPERPIAGSWTPPDDFMQLTGICGDFEIEIEVDWDGTTGAYIDVERSSGSPSHVTENVYFYDDTYASISGPGTMVCQSFTQGNYQLQNWTSAGLSTYSWSTTSTGSSLSVAAPTDWSTNISGFTPDNYYTLNCSLYCDANLEKVVSKTVITGLSCKINDLESDALIKKAVEEKIEELSHSKEPTDFDINQIKNYLPDIVAKTEAITITPNPLRSGTQLKINIPRNLLLEKVGILDLYGKKLQEFSYIPESGEILLEKLPAGPYILQMEIEGHSIVKKLIIE